MKIIVEGRWNAAFSFNRKGRYPMNFFEKELRNLFGNSSMLRDAHYCGRTCLAKLDENLRVKLQFTTTGYADHYDAIKLAVINRTDGVVDQQLFRFSDIIGQQAVEGRDPINPHIWDYNGRLEWYPPHLAGAALSNRQHYPGLRGNVPRGNRRKRLYYETVKEVSL